MPAHIKDGEGTQRREAEVGDSPSPPSLGSFCLIKVSLLADLQNTSNITSSVRSSAVQSHACAFLHVAHTLALHHWSFNAGEPNVPILTE